MFFNMSQKKKNQPNKEVQGLFPLGRENYKLMIIGLIIIISGFILMIGGGSDDPNVFNEDIFSFRRITLAPFVVLFGFLFQIYAIMKKPKTEEE
jgi:membrane-bound ClpP family serine protease